MAISSEEYLLVRLMSYVKIGYDNCIGILLTLFVQSFHTLSWHQLRSGVTRVPLLCTIGGLFALASVGHWTRLKIVERSWVGDRSFPGGPLKFYDSMSTSALNIVGLAS